MEQHNEQLQGISMEDAMRLAKSDAGQQLLQLLQSTHGTEMEHAFSQAAAGEYSKLKKTLEALLTSPKARELVEQLRG